MTSHRELKDRVRQRMESTGESYAAARVHVMRARAEHLGEPTEAAAESSLGELLPKHVEAIVLKVNDRSARVRIVGEPGEVTLRAGAIDQVVPGHVITLTLKRRWRWRGDAYASGTIESTRIDVDALGIEPLPVQNDGLEDLRSMYEPVRYPDPYAPLWRRLTAKPRLSLVLDHLAWGLALDDVDDDDDEFEPPDPVGDAVDLRNAGRYEEAFDLLMDVLHRDLRCIDAHAHLGNFVADLDRDLALAHYQVGRRIAELSLPTGFDGVLLWGHLNNRPYLRCLHGEGLCLWGLGRLAEATAVFERMLSLNPNDNQGARACLWDVCAGRSWAEAMRDDEVEALHG